MDRRLILEGGFVVDDGRTRLLKERAGALGFEDLGAYLQACCDAGRSVPRIATELGVRDWQVQAALARIGVRLAPRPQRLAQQRRRHTEQRIAARVAMLGFAEVRAYLVDWVVERAWLLAEVAAELAAHRRTMRRPLDSYGIRRVRRTSAERTASESGRRVQAVGWHARRAGRLAELGFQDLAGWQAQPARRPDPTAVCGATVSRVRKGVHPPCPPQPFGWPHHQGQPPPSTWPPRWLRSTAAWALAWPAPSTAHRRWRRSPPAAPPWTWPWVSAACPGAASPRSTGPRAPARPPWPCR